MRCRQSTRLQTQIKTETATWQLSVLSNTHTHSHGVILIWALLAGVYAKIYRTNTNAVRNSSCLQQLMMFCRVIHWNGSIPMENVTNCQCFASRGFVFKHLLKPYTELSVESGIFCGNWIIRHLNYFVSYSQLKAEFLARLSLSLIPVCCQWAKKKIDSNQHQTERASNLKKIVNTNIENGQEQNQEK